MGLCDVDFVGWGVEEFGGFCQYVCLRVDVNFCVVMGDWLCICLGSSC